MFADTNLGITPATCPLRTKVPCNFTVELENEVRGEIPGAESAGCNAALDEQHSLGQKWSQLAVA